MNFAEIQPILTKNNHRPKILNYYFSTSNEQDSYEYDLNT